MAKDEIHVTMTSAHTYRTGPSLKRTLPQGWAGYVPEAVAKEIEKAGAGKRTPAKDRPWEKPAAKKKATGGQKADAKASTQDKTPSSQGAAPATPATGAETDASKGDGGELNLGSAPSTAPGAKDSQAG